MIVSDEEIAFVNVSSRLAKLITILYSALRHLYRKRGFCCVEFRRHKINFIEGFKL